MRSGVLAQKIGMMRLFTEAGEHVPVTVLRLGNCQVLGHRTKDKNGYVALQLGAGQRKVQRTTKADRGHFAVAKVEPIERCEIDTPWLARSPWKFQRFMPPAKPLPVEVPVTSTYWPTTK